MSPKFEMAPKDKPEETLEEILERFGGKLDKGPDRRKDSVGKSQSDTKKDEENAIYGPFRKAHKNKKEKESDENINRLAADAQHMIWNYEERGGDRIEL